MRDFILGGWEGLRGRNGLTPEQRVVAGGVVGIGLLNVVLALVALAHGYGVVQVGWPEPDFLNARDGVTLEPLDDGDGFRVRTGGRTVYGTWERRLHSWLYRLGWRMFRG